MDSLWPLHRWLPDHARYSDSTRPPVGATTCLPDHTWTPMGPTTLVLPTHDKAVPVQAVCQDCSRLFHPRRRGCSAPGGIAAAVESCGSIPSSCVPQHTRLFTELPGVWPCQWRPCVLPIPLRIAVSLACPFFHIFPIQIVHSLTIDCSIRNPRCPPAVRITATDSSAPVGRPDCSQRRTGMA